VSSQTDLLASNLSVFEGEEPEQLRAQVQVTLRLRGSVGGEKETGLARVKLYDFEGSEVRLKASCIACQAFCLQPVANLIKPNPYTDALSEMFLAEFPHNANCLDVRISYSGQQPGLLRVWNFNSGKSKCTKSIQVLVDGSLIAEQVLLVAPQSTEKKYHQDIVLTPDTCIPEFLSPRSLSRARDRSFEQLFDKLEKERADALAETNDRTKKPTPDPLVDPLGQDALDIESSMNRRREKPPSPSKWESRANREEGSKPVSGKPAYLKQAFEDFMTNSRDLLRFDHTLP